MTTQDELFKAFEEAQIHTKDCSQCRNALLMLKRPYYFTQRELQPYRCFAGRPIFEKWLDMKDSLGLSA